MDRLIVAGLAALLAWAPAAAVAQPSEEAVGVPGGATVRGRVTFGDSALRPAQPNRIVVRAALAATESLGQVAQAPVADDGTFEIEGLIGPRIILIGGMLQLSSSLTSATSILGAVAVLIATINVAGGFLVTSRMLAMFRR